MQARVGWEAVRSGSAASGAEAEVQLRRAAARERRKCSLNGPSLVWLFFVAFGNYLSGSKY